MMTTLSQRPELAGEPAALRTAVQTAVRTAVRGGNGWAAG